MVKIKKIEHNKYSKNMEQVELSYIAGRNTK